MTDIDEMLAFIHAALDEDEQIARKAPGPKWAEAVEREGTPGHWFGVRAYLVTLAADPDLTGLPEQPAEILRAERVVDRLGSPAWAVSHAARHDPARVLAKVNATRRIVDRCEAAIADDTREGEALMKVLATLVLKDLAAEYADRHPGYREEWRP